MKRLCEDLREHPIKIINYKKKEMIPLTIWESHIMNKIFAIYAKKQSSTDDKKYYKVRDHCHYTGK